MRGRLLVSEFGFDKFTVEAGNVAQRNVLGTFGCACACVCAVTKSEFVHLPDHCAGTACAFHLTLRQECELAYLGADKKHCRAVLQAATQAPQPIHVAESIATSATSFEMGRLLASGAPPQLNDT